MGWRKILFFILLTGIAFQVSGQDSRLAISEQERQEQLKKVKPAKSSKIIKFLDTAENVGIDQYIQFNVQDFRLGFGQISPLSGITPAIRWEQPRIGSTDLTVWLSGAYSIHSHQAYEFQFGYFEKPAPRDYQGHSYPEFPFDVDYRSQDDMRPFLYADSMYRVFPKEEYFGLGGDSLKNNHSIYKMEEYTGGVIGGYQFTRSIVAKARLEFVQPTLHNSPYDNYDETSTVFNESTAPGLTSQPSFIRYGASLVAAHYGDPFKPSGLISLDVARYKDREGGNFTFTRYQFDGRGYLTLGCRQRVIAARFFVSHDDPAENAIVPFYMMESIGGQDTLRGFHNFRFTDRNILYMSTEYRWEGNPAVELAVFYDTGKAFADPADLNFQHLEHSYGFGIRFKNLRKTVIRFDIGWSKENTFLYVAPSVAF